MGKPPAGDLTSRQIAAASRVGISVTSHTTSSIDVAEVDQGNATATVTAAQSGSCASCLRSIVIDERTRSSKVVAKSIFGPNMWVAVGERRFRFWGLRRFGASSAKRIWPAGARVLLHMAEAIEREVGQTGDLVRSRR